MKFKIGDKICGKMLIPNPENTYTIIDISNSGLTNCYKVKKNKAHFTWNFCRVTTDRLYKKIYGNHHPHTTIFK